ncbi:alpha/beta fold hydrolase [Fluviispira multicolorata]|uniref:Alpha/beta fold hydrolase n=1 Tax=Fluviispira multicolorata TaxID=2654512 RepID=A0A833N4Z9_9BACT|nr:alpha/beta hydrolase [Fluviispira multicolorata]KAB8033352.1 alpha/beta fold hydrolase [Fluviispira multicolorata]
MNNLEFSSLPQSLFDAFLTEETGVQFLEFEGARIAFDFQPAKETCQNLLILVNGYQRSRLDFRAFRKKIERLSPNTATLSLDNRFCGETIVNDLESLSVQIMARDVCALAAIYCQKLNLNSFSLLGISMGGMIVQTLAAHNENVEKLFLVSTTAGGSGRIWPVHVNDPKNLKFKNNYITLESTKEHMFRYFGKRFLQGSPLLFDMMCKSILKARVENESNTDKGAEIQFYASAEFDGVSFLSQIKAKTFIISGNEDQIIPVENSYYLKENIESSNLKVYEGVGHLILVEEADKFVEDVSAFLI